MEINLRNNNMLYLNNSAKYNYVDRHFLYDVRLSFWQNINAIAKNDINLVLNVNHICNAVFFIVRVYHKFPQANDDNLKISKSLVKVKKIQIL